MTGLAPSIAVAGRILLASLFVLGALNKALTYDETLMRMVDAGLSPAAMLLPLTIALEVFGGLAIIYGRTPAAIAGLGLAAYVFIVNLVFHPFWTFDDPVRDIELSLFFKNISIMGGLTFVAATSLSQNPGAANAQI
ncbi:MAG: DoxX family membrane protein [Pseudomonadota bacterium]